MTGPIDLGFLVFAQEVATRFERLVLFARTARVPPPSDSAPLSGVELIELPYYDRLANLPAALHGAAGTVAGFWRGLTRVDLVWVFGPNPFGLALIALALVRRKQVVLGVRQDTLAYYRHRLPSRLWTPALVAVQAMEHAYRALARRHRATVVGRELERRYRSRSSSVFPMTVSLVRLRDIPATPPERDWSGRIELLTVGRLEPEKNPLLLVEALARLEARRPGRYSLTWVGSGALESEVRKRASELGVAHNLRLRGHVPFGSDLLDLYRRAHAFVHVSLTEGVPQVIIEALACGTPVVATDVGGVAAALDAGKAGILAPPDDAEELVAGVLRLTDDADLRRRLTIRGLELARATSMEAEAGRVARFLLSGRTDARR
jgi:glycosyltransferase involved in cell wall biosynthesis